MHSSRNSEFRDFGVHTVFSKGPVYRSWGHPEKGSLEVHGNDGALIFALETPSKPHSYPNLVVAGLSPPQTSKVAGLGCS